MFRWPSASSVWKALGAPSPASLFGLAHGAARGKAGRRQQAGLCQKMWNSPVGDTAGDTALERQEREQPESGAWGRERRRDAFCRASRGRILASPAK